MNTDLSELLTADGPMRLFDASMKITLLLGGLLLASALLRGCFKSSAAHRASLLFLGSIAVPIIALTSFTTDPQQAVWDIEIASPTAPLVVESATTPAKTAPDPIGSAISFVAISFVATKLNMPSTNPTVGAEAVEKQRGWQLPSLSQSIIGIWICGMLLVAARLLVGIATLESRVRKLSTRIDSGSLAKSLAARCSQLGIRRLPRLFLARRDGVMPMTWGGWKSGILLPSDAESWGSDRLDLVLRHELAHIKRRDCVCAWAMRLLLAPAWFHPLAWLIGRQASELRERACDDSVTQQLNDPDRYARELVSFSKDRHTLTGSLAMARPRRLEARIRAMYTPQISRGGSSGMFRTSISLTLAIGLVPLSLFTACQTTPEVEKEPEAATVAKKKPIAKPTWSVTPAPDFRGGAQKVSLQITTVFVPPEALTRNESELTPASKKLRELHNEAIKCGSGKGVAVSAADMAQLGARGRDTFLAAEFASGKPHHLKLTNGNGFPNGPDLDPSERTEGSKELGTHIDVRVDRQPAGTLVVDAKVIMRGTRMVRGNRKINSGWTPALVEYEGQTGKVVVENGGFIVLGKLREHIQLSRPSIPVVDRIPLVQRMIESEDRYYSLVFVEVKVAD